MDFAQFGYTALKLGNVVYWESARETTMALVLASTSDDMFAADYAISVPASAPMASAASPIATVAWPPAWPLTEPDVAQTIITGYAVWVWVSVFLGAFNGFSHVDLNLIVFVQAGFDWHSRRPPFLVDGAIANRGRAASATWAFGPGHCGCQLTGV